VQALLELDIAVHSFQEHGGEEVEVQVSPEVYIAAPVVSSLTTGLLAWLLARGKFSSDLEVERTKHEQQLQTLRNEHRHQDQARFMEKRADLYHSFPEAVSEWRQASDAAASSLSQLVAGFDQTRGLGVDYKDLSSALDSCAHNQRRAATAQASLLGLIRQFEHHAPAQVHSASSAWLQCVVRGSDSANARECERAYNDAVRTDLRVDSE
jgi:hypothetical protein